MEALKCLVAKVCIFTLFYRSIVTILKINLLFGIVGSCKKPDLQLRKVTWHLITGVEKNDDLRRYFHRKINRWDAATNLLLVEKRQEELREEERAKQPYEKRDSSYWMDAASRRLQKRLPEFQPQFCQQHQRHKQWLKVSSRRRKFLTSLPCLSREQGRSCCFCLRDWR